MRCEMAKPKLPNDVVIDSKMFKFFDIRSLGYIALSIGMQI